MIALKPRPRLKLTLHQRADLLLNRLNIRNGYIRCRSLYTVRRLHEEINELVSDYSNTISSPPEDSIHTKIERIQFLQTLIRPNLPSPTEGPRV